MTAPRELEWSIRDLLRATAFPHPVSEILLQETPLSWVITTGSYAYKIKRPIHREFIDSSTLARRHALCLEELRLNRRLASALYCDVVTIRRSPQGLHIGGDGDVVDYAVKMHQFDRHCELSSLLDRRLVTCKQMAQFGELIAEFHRKAERNCESDYFERLRNIVLGNLATLLAHLTDTADAPSIDHLIDWLHDFICDHRAEFSARQKIGSIREGHGDLHARNIVMWQGALLPFDCLEFDPHLRFVDTLDDIAFLVMDLLTYKRDDLACAFLSRYCEHTGDYAGLCLLPFYGVHRALVRATVDAFAVEGGTSGVEIRSRLHRRIAVADRLARPTNAALIIMHGLSGSGKSHLSENLIDILPAVRIRSDFERKRLAEFAGKESGGLYSPAMNDRTYDQLLVGAKGALSAGFNVLVDATFLRCTDRARFATLAKGQNAPFVIIDCQASDEILVKRIEQRRLQGRDPSEADAQVLKLQKESAQPLDENELRHTINVRTDLTQSDAYLEELKRRLKG